MPLGIDVPKPESFDMTPNSEAHRKIKDFIRTRMDFSKRRLAARRVAWRDAEKQHRAFLDLEQVDKARRVKDRDATYPGFAPLIIPISYATVNTILTFLMTVYGSRRPTIQVEGIGPEDIKPAEAIETVVGYQMEHARLLLKLRLWFQDMLVYGVGWMRNTWRRKFSYQTVLEVPPGMGAISRVFGFDPPKRKVTRWVKGYEGNWPEVLDPFRVWPDPRVPVTSIQEGEFICFTARKSLGILLQEEKEGLYFNVESLKTAKFPGIASGREDYGSDIPRQMKLQSLDEDQFVDKVDRGYPLLEECWARIIPQDLGIGESRDPQIWVFTLANKQVVIRAEPSAYNHGEFPIDGIEYMPDVHTTLNPGVVELIQPLGEHLSWLFNSRMENVRKAVNDMFVYDPSRVEQKDMEARGPGKMIRLRQHAYGQDVRTAVHQLAVTDVTIGHLRDAKVIIDLIQRVSAATDNFMGLPTVGARRTATEVRGIQQLAGGRLKLLAETISLMGFTPFAKKSIMNTQQLMEDTRFFRILGRNLTDPEIMDRIKVSPEEIIGNFDFPLLDGTFPTDRFTVAQAWKDIFMAVVNVEPLLKIFDVVKIFGEGAKALGIKNIEDFRLQPGSVQTKVMEDRELESRVKKGNAVPVSGPGAPPEAAALGQLLGVPGTQEERGDGVGR